MKVRFLAISLLFYFLIGALLPRTDFSQLLQLHHLFEHYQLHKIEAEIEGTELSLSSFLMQHLFEYDDHEHEDQQEHEQLPFHQISTSLTFFMPNYIDPDQTEMSMCSPTPNAYLLYILEGVGSSVFHPPSFS